MSAIYKHGSEEQKQEWLPRMASGEVIGCFGLTEPTAGSDLANMLTTARRDGDEWGIDGAKRWIGLANVAQVAIIWAKAAGMVRGFIVPTDTQGFTATPITQKLSLRASIQCEISLDGVPIPSFRRIPASRAPSCASTRRALASASARWVLHTTRSRPPLSKGASLASVGSAR